MVDATIVGAGIGGLSLAYYLHKAGLRVKLIDSGSVVGGVIGTEEKNGFLLEHGPNSSLAKPAMLRLVESLGAKNTLLQPQAVAKNRYLALGSKNGSKTRLIAAPHGPIEAIQTPLLTYRAKLRLLIEPCIGGKQEEDESVREFVTRRLGSEVCEQLVAPMLQGVWAADIGKLSTRSALPLLWSLEHDYGSLIGGGLRKAFSKSEEKNKKGPRQKRKLSSFTHGMRELAQLAAAKIPPQDIHLSCLARRIDWKPNECALECFSSENNETFSLQTKNVILALAAGETAALVEPLSSTLCESLRSIPYAPLGILHLSYGKEAVEHPLDGFGFLVPPNLKMALLGAVFSSSLFTNRAPENKHLLTCFVGGAANPDFSDVTRTDIQQQVIGELSSLIGAKTQPEILGSTYWERSIPNYALGHHLIKQAAGEFESNFPGIHFLGSWHHGISVSDRIEHAEKLAQKLISQTEITAQTHHPER